MQSVTLSIPDMTCGNCVRHVREALAAVPGVGVSSIDLAHKLVQVEVGGPTALSAAQASLTEAGYPATVSTSG